LTNENEYWVCKQKTVMSDRRKELFCMQPRCRKHIPGVSFLWSRPKTAELWLAHGKRALLLLFPQFVSRYMRWRNVEKHSQPEWTLLVLMFKAKLPVHFLGI
jgi:hypothetical protein